jgi:hypothetical protein
MDRVSHLARFYVLVEEAIRRSGGVRQTSTCSGRDTWPARGVYFFFEPGQVRTHSGVGSRVVRVGTHGLKTGSRTSLWNRLSQHRGSMSTEGGNHRGSIFRLLVGAALIERECLQCSSWGEGSSADAGVRQGEREVERAVSRHIGRMEVAWVDIPDDAGPDSERGYVERNTIALLSNAARSPVDPPTVDWLGNSCPRRLVRGSGLWNQNHVTEAYDPGFLDRFASLIQARTS